MCKNLECSKCKKRITESELTQFYDQFDDVVIFFQDCPFCCSKGIIYQHSILRFEEIESK